MLKGNATDGGLKRRNPFVLARRLRLKATGFTRNEVIENSPGVGGWGGSCTCPDGQVYQVGDLKDDCGTLACEGGVSGTCNEVRVAYFYVPVGS